MSDLVAKAKMLIRCPASEVFDAFVQAERITQFWLQSTTGPLAQGASVEWQFMVPGAKERVNVTSFVRPSHLAFTWVEGGLAVDMQFIEEQSGITIASVDVTGFQDEGGMEQVVNASEGFSIVLCDLKVLLETGRSANLVKDKAELIHSQAASDAN
jgi:uncharacterized protein YndB with AHSA1/START domain